MSRGLWTPCKQKLHHHHHDPLPHPHDGSGRIAGRQDLAIISSSFSSLIFADHVLHHRSDCVHSNMEGKDGGKRRNVIMKRLSLTLLALLLLLIILILIIIPDHVLHLHPVSPPSHRSSCRVRLLVRRIIIEVEGWWEEMAIPQMLQARRRREARGTHSSCCPDHLVCFAPRSHHHGRGKT